MPLPLKNLLLTCPRFRLGHPRFPQEFIRPVRGIKISMASSEFDAEGLESNGSSPLILLLVRSSHKENYAEFAYWLVSLESHARLAHPILFSIWLLFAAV